MRPIAQIRKLELIACVLLINCFNVTLAVVNTEGVKWKSELYEIKSFSYYQRGIIDSVKFVDFDDFKTIKLWNVNVTCYKYSKKLIYFGFMPDKRILLDRSFEQDSFEHFSSVKVKLYAYRVKGFDVDLFHVNLASKHTRKTYFFFLYSNFFLYKSQQLIDELTCRKSLFTKNAYFESLFSISFQYGTKYSRKTCAYMFKNAYISEIFLYGLTNCFTQRNMLGFIANDRLNMSNDYTYFSIFKIKVDRYLLDENVFETSLQLAFRGEIESFASDAFKNLKKLIGISLYVSNLNKFYHQGIGWMHSLYIPKRVNISNKTDVANNLDYLKVINTFWQESLIDENAKNLQRPYLYPDEDFCLFRHFPFDRLVYVDPQTICVKNNCSCTQYWLLKHIYLLRNSNKSLTYLTSYTYGQEYFLLDKYEKETEACNFSRRLKNCDDIKPSSRQITTDATFKGELADSQTVDFAMVILIPIVGALGMVVNVINIKTIMSIDLKKTPEEQQQKSLIRFMLVYSIINLIYCFIESTSPMSKCIELNSIYCPDLYFTQFAQYHKMIFIEFMGSNLKTWSNVIYFCISANRYILLEKESKLADLIGGRLSKWSTKKRTFWSTIIFILIAGLNTHKIIIYKVMKHSATKLFYGLYPEFFFSLPFFLANSNSYENAWNYESADDIRQKSTLFEAFTFVNFILNDVLLFFCFTVVDMLLIMSFRRSLEKKRTFYKDRLNETKVQNQLTQLEQTVENAMRLIIVNTCVLLVIKIFDIFMSVSKFKIWRDDLATMDQKRKLNGFCHTVKICIVYDELVKVLYMLYYCFSIVSFYYLNSKFRLNLEKIVKINNKHST